MNATFRPAEAADLPALHALIESAFRGDSARRGWSHEADLLEGQRIDLDMLADILSDDHQKLIVAVDAASEFVGCVLIAKRPMGVAYVGLLTVAPDIQGGGVGGSLLAEAERIGRDVFCANLAEMTVIKQREDLVTYYERRGWRRSGREEPFPYGDSRYGLPKRPDLVFVVLTKALA